MSRIILLYDLATQNETKTVCELLGNCLHYVSLLHDQVNISCSVINVEMHEKMYLAVNKSTYFIMIISKLDHIRSHLTKKYRNNPITHITSSRLCTLDSQETLQPSNIQLLNIDVEEDKNILAQNLHKHIINSSLPFKNVFQRYLFKIFAYFQTRKQQVANNNNITISDKEEEETEKLIPIIFV